MTLSELRSRIQQGESDRTEFKRSTAELTGAMRTLCAFLNGEGGSVFLGVGPDGRAVGQEVSDGTLRDLAAALSRLEPPVNLQPRLIPVEGTPRQIIELRAEASPDSMPCVYEGRPYRRIGTTTSPMPLDVYHRMLLDRLHATRRWENTPCDYSILDLNEEEVYATLRRASEVGRLAAVPAPGLTDVLARLGLVQDNRLLHAAVVLFGRRFLPDYPQCHLRLARFRGTTKSEFLDQRQLHGNAFRLLEESLQFMARHLPVAGRIQPGLFERQDEPLFPPVALREALVNALCHRDYTAAGGATSLAIFDDRLEIWSHGPLPQGIGLEDLKRDHLSRPRNPLIADVFYLRGLVERWGRGTQTIVELCVRAGHPEPEFLEQSGSVGVRFLPSGYIAPTRIELPLTDRHREMLSLLAGHEHLALREIMAKLSDPPSARALRDDLYHLQRLGLVRSTGRGRGAVWLLQR